MAGRSQDYYINLKARNEELKRKLADTRTRMRSYNSFTKNIGKQVASNLAVMFGVGLSVDLIKDITVLTGKYQKYAAVLENTLGSGSAAKQALDEIKEFGATTPFSVDQITASFIKLANQGFVPTMRQMTQLGDLASSTGKDFDQLAEAILDAQVGEFERLKEFGIRAKKQGDQVTFTFKGVQTQVEFTEKSIQNYLLSLGDVKGVTGSMAAISGTLEGKLSNLQDSFEQLKVKIGEVSAEPLEKVLGTIGEMMTAVSNLNTLTGVLFKDFDDLSSKEVFTLVDAGMITESGKQVKELLKPFLEMPKSEIAGNIDEIKKKFTEAFKTQGEELSDINHLWSVYFSVITKDFSTGPVTGFESLIETLEKQKLVTEQNTQATTAYIDALGRLQSLDFESESMIDFAGIDIDSFMSSMDEIEDYLSNLPSITQTTFSDWESSLGKNYDRILEIAKANNIEFIEANADMLEKLDILLKDMTSIVESGLENSIAAFADGIGSGGGIEAAFQGLFNVVGSGLQNLGKSLIAYGVSLDAFKKAITNPYVAIAAGVAAVAAGAAVKNAASNMAGSVGGGGYSSYGGSSGTNNANSFGGFQAQNINVEVSGKLSANPGEIFAEIENYKSRGVRRW